ncbi:MAG: TolC family protein [Flavipsychrobacter sp.]|nr:TolC family protein [Flavipsychrobacter sp.]
MLYKQLAKNMCSICCLYFLQTNTLYAQGPTLPAADTIRLEIKQAEKMFLDSNLQLLAAHYNIRSSEALVIQAKKWDNPMLITDQNVYANKHFFQHGNDVNGNPQGQVFVQVQQLIKTAGKRGKQTDLARTNVNIAEWQFKSVMRNLRATLIKDFYTIAQLQGNAVLYNENMQRLTKLLQAQSGALQAGNIARKEYLRVQALILSLQQDMTENAKALNDAQSELKTLLQITGNKFILPVVPETENADMPALSVLQITDSAKQYNTDYQQQVYQLQYNRQNVRLQKALSVPDLTVGPEFDQNSNYTPNYYGLTLSLPIPLWDRNQGNIRSAKFQVKQDETMLQMADQKLQNDVLNAYQKLLYATQLSSGNNAQFYTDYYQLQKNITDSYNKRQISMIEFLDYYKDYIDVKEKQLQQVLNLRLAKADLNDIAGVDIAK